MTLRTLNYGNYGIFLIMGHAGFCPSTVGLGLGAVLQMLGKAREQLQSGIGSPELDPNDQSLMLTALKPKP